MTNNNRAVVYITNQHPFYLKMALCSIGMLRQHNKKIPVKVFLIRDQSTQTIERENISRHLNNNEETTAKFIESCNQMNVEVLERIPLVLPGEEKFFHINRKYIFDVREENILYVDADTFIFDDIDKVFDHYQYVDFAACKAEWAFGRGWSYEFLVKPVGPFSSGLMLWNNGTIRDWCDRLPYYLSEFRKNETTLAHWLHQLHPDCLLREEFSVTKHISETNLTHSFIEQDDCHLIRSEQCLAELGKAIIFHSYTPLWRKCYTKLNYGARKIAFGSINKK